MALTNSLYGSFEGRKISADFSQLTWHAQDAEALKKIINKIWGVTKFNPKYNVEYLTRMVARMRELPPEHFLMTNGSAEAVYIIAQAFRSSASTVIIPTRQEYEAACKANKHELVFVLKEQLAPATSMPGGLAFICHPGNLDGALLDRALLESLLQHNPNTYFVVDQTYIHYVHEAEDLTPLLPGHSNLVLLHSISQSYGFPGLPIGYIAAHPAFIEKVQVQKPPHSFNAIAVEMAKYVLTHNERFQIPSQQFLKEREALQEMLKQIDGLHILDSRAPFFLVELPGQNGAEFVKFMWEKFSVIIKEVGSYRGLKGNYIRLIAKSSNENYLLLKGLRNWFGIEG